MLTIPLFASSFGATNIHQRSRERNVVANEGEKDGSRRERSLAQTY